MLTELVEKDQKRLLLGVYFGITSVHGFLDLRITLEEGMLF